MTNRRLLIFAVFTVCFCLTVMAQAADTAKAERQVTVQGRGKVSAVPDQARLAIAVSEEGPRVDTVSQQVRSKMEAVIKALKAEGIAEKDIQTQFYRIAPKMVWKNNRSVREGYTVSNQVEAIVRDLKKTGAVLAAVEEAGANDINGPQFDFQNPQDLERKALAMAIEDAMAKADVLAHAAGAGLGETLRIDEAASFRPGPRPMMMAMKARSDAPAEEPIAAGQETVEATVNAAFALK